jgi:hypothetical protein
MYYSFASMGHADIIWFIVSSNWWHSLHLLSVSVIIIVVFSSKFQKQFLCFGFLSKVTVMCNFISSVRAKYLLISSSPFFLSIFLSVVQQPLVCQGLIIAALRSHPDATLIMTSLDK